MPEGARGQWPRRSIPALAVVGMFAFLLAEVSLLVAVAGQIGWWILVAFVVSTALGAFLLQREWRKAWGQLSDSLNSGSLPPGRTADAVLVLLGGFMLIMPGFITDVLGLLLLLPFTRPAVRSVLGRWASGMVAGTGAASGMTIHGEVVDVGQPENKPGQGPTIEGTILEAKDPEDS